ncbi:MAG TPA: hypothetical protein VMQ76_07230, partial [Terracidiphilus sp.]|nr:hypothetical protein [Terracidiphilus sp.]
REDTIKIQILDNGQIKIETNAVSGPNHTGAESLLREIARLAGGPTKRTMKVGAHLHAALHAHCADGHSHQ